MLGMLGMGPPCAPCLSRSQLRATGWRCDRCDCKACKACKATRIGSTHKTVSFCRILQLKDTLHSAPCPASTLKNTGRSHDSRHSHHFYAFKPFGRAIIVKVYVVVHHSPWPSCMIFLDKSHDHVDAQVFGGASVRMRMIVLTIHPSKLCPSNRIRG